MSNKKKDDSTNKLNKALNEGHIKGNKKKPNKTPKSDTKPPPTNPKNKGGGDKGS